MNTELLPPISALCDRILDLVSVRPAGCTALWLHLRIADLDDDADETLLAIGALTRAGLLATGNAETCTTGHRTLLATGARGRRTSPGCRLCGQPVRSEVVYVRGRLSRRLDIGPAMTGCCA